MRFMSMIKGPEGAPPTPELMAAVGGMAQELMQKGVLVEMGGLLPSSKGTRMRLAAGTPIRAGTSLLRLALAE